MLLRNNAVERERVMIPGRSNERIGPGDGEEDSERWSGTGCLVGVCVGQREEEWVGSLVGVEGEIGKNHADAKREGGVVPLLLQLQSYNSVAPASS
jgi:hypothetical protein